MGLVAGVLQWRDTGKKRRGALDTLLNKGQAVGIVYPNFSKPFDTVSQKILTEKLLMYRLDEQRVRWNENWLNGQPQRAGQWHKVWLGASISRYSPGVNTGCSPVQHLH